MLVVKIVLAITALIDFFLSALIFLKAKPKLANRSIAGLVFCLGLWAFSVLMLYHTQSLFWGRATIVSVYPVVSFFYMFVQEFPYSPKGRAITRWWYVWIPTFAVLIFSPTTLLLRSQTVRNGTMVPSFGPLYHLLVLIGLLLVAYALWNIIRRYGGLPAIHKMQLKYVGLGFLLFILTVIVSNVALPLLGIHSFNKIGPSFTLILVSFTTYAIVRYRLSDIRLLVARGIMYIGFILTVFALYTIGIVKIISFLNRTLNIRIAIFNYLIVAAMIFSWPYLRKYLEKLTDRIFYQGRYDRQGFLKQIGAICSSASPLDDLASNLVQVISREMRLDKGGLVILGHTGDEDTRSFGFSITPDLVQAIKENLNQRGILVTDELDEYVEIKHLLRQNKIAIVMPLWAESELIGLLALGEKLSGNAFTIEDIELLEILENEISVSIQNALFYEEIQGFNKILRREIGEATAELRAANEELQRLDKAKDEFVSIASHQLRAPLTAIRGFISLAQQVDQGSANAEQRECLEMAAKSAERLLNLIDDMLTISRIGEKLHINAVEFPLEEVVKQVAEEERFRAEEKGLSLHFQKPEQHLPLVRGDPDKIRNALMNIVDNAINYTEEGNVLIEVLRDNGEIMVSVKDTGIGISEEELPKLFSRFARGDRAKHIVADGSGLGLYIAKKIIEAHKGQIWVKSIEGKGSTFTFSLPLS